MLKRIKISKNNDNNKDNFLSYYNDLATKGKRKSDFCDENNKSSTSFKLETYREATTQCPDGFGLNWSIYEWQQAKEGDFYYMVRVGDDKAGIFFRGEFRSDPYSGEDWAGKGKPRKYVDITCEWCADPDGKPWLSVEELSAAIPEINWGSGHSGELLSTDVATKLEDLWNECIDQYYIAKKGK